MKTSTVHLVRTIARSSLYNYRHRQDRLYPSLQALQHIHRCYCSEPLPLPNEPKKSYSPKIQKIVDDISQLTLLEVSDLNELLKSTLNIQDAPVMAMGMATAAPVQQETEDEGAAAPQKMSFTVKLTGYKDDKKIAVIKELKNLIPGTNLVQAKKMVEAAPVVINSDISQKEADELLKSLQDAGAEAIIE